MAVTESVAKACTWLDIEKQKEAAKRVFIKETGSVSWQNAQDTYPAHAEKLMKFAGNYYLKKNGYKIHNNQEMLQSFALDNIHSHNVKIYLKPLKTQVIQMLFFPIPGRSLIWVHIIPHKEYLIT